MLGYLVTALKTNPHITQIKLECKINTLVMLYCSYFPVIDADNTFDDDAAVLLFESLEAFPKLFFFSLLGECLSIVQCEYHF